MKEIFKKTEAIRNDRITFRGFLGSFILTGISMLYILLFYRKLPPLIPIFNQLPWGEERIIGTPFIFLPVIVSLFISVFNLFYASFVYEKSPLIGRVFAAISFSISSLTFIFIIRTIQIVL